jgi:hypothetical protein
VVLAVLLTACGGGSSNVVRPPASEPAATSTASSPAASSSPVKVNPKLTITPAKGLRDKQVVHVSATGFSPALALTVIECADKGTRTGPGDCNLTGMVAASTDSSGSLTVDLPVLRGPFGANNIVCSTTQHCLVSVTQASLSPTEEVDGEIMFGG